MERNMKQRTSWRLIVLPLFIIVLLGLGAFVWFAPDASIELIKDGEKLAAWSANSTGVDLKTYLLMSSTVVKVQCTASAHETGRDDQFAVLEVIKGKPQETIAVAPLTLEQS